MTAIKILPVLSSLSAGLGTYVLYKGSFAYESFPFYASNKLIEEMGQRNKKRKRAQFIGVTLLLLAVLFQIIAQCLSANP